MARAGIIEAIKDTIATQQQEAGLKAYAENIEETERSPSFDDFQTFYVRWCKIEGLFNDNLLDFKGECL